MSDCIFVSNKNISCRDFKTKQLIENFVFMSGFQNCIDFRVDDKEFLVGISNLN